MHRLNNGCRGRGGAEPLHQVQAKEHARGACPFGAFLPIHVGDSEWLLLQGHGDKVTVNPPAYVEPNIV